MWSEDECGSMEYKKNKLCVVTTVFRWLGIWLDVTAAKHDIRLINDPKAWCVSNVTGNQTYLFLFSMAWCVGSVAVNFADKYIFYLRADLVFEPGHCFGEEDTAQYFKQTCFFGSEILCSERFKYSESVRTDTFCELKTK